MRSLDLTAEQKSDLRGVLIDRFYRKTDHYAGAQFYRTVDASYFETEAGRAELDNQVTGRVKWFHQQFMPWLGSEMSLSGIQILEVGAGTGSSTVVLADAGAAHIDAVDIDPYALEIARMRSSLYGFTDIAFHCRNATEIGAFSSRPYDVVILFATLEHMTYEERKSSLPLAWSAVKQGGLLCILDTPNRLWYMDRHTSLMPFFHWLPDDLAVDYAKRVPRHAVARDFQDTGPGAQERLARWGRTVSYHDLELTIGPMDGSLPVSGMAEFYRRKDPAWAKVWADTPEGRYLTFLQSVAPQIPSPFFEEGLNLVIRKPG